MEHSSATRHDRPPGGAAPIEPMLPEPFRVAGVRRETASTVTLDLERADGGPARPAAPGQFNMVYAFGVGEIPVSISGGADGSGCVVHTVREVGAVSRAICAARHGDVLGVRGPYGTPWPIEDAAGGDVVIVGGGIGLAPLRPVIHHVRAHRERFGRVSVLYGCRTPDEVLFVEELERLRSGGDLDVHVTVDARTREWGGSVGPVTVLFPRIGFDPANARAFVCGPEIMMRFVARELAERGVGGERVFVSAERNMKCAIGFCGHCQLGPAFICKDGPVFAYARIAPLMRRTEL